MSRCVCQDCGEPSRHTYCPWHLRMAGKAGHRWPNPHNGRPPLIERLRNRVIIYLKLDLL